jgi:hypothetical protein
MSRRLPLSLLQLHALGPHVAGFRQPRCSFACAVLCELLRQPEPSVILDIVQLLTYSTPLSTVRTASNAKVHMKNSHQAFWRFQRGSAAGEQTSC